VSESQRVIEPWHRRFQSLMPFRIREILLVSSAYDAFVLEEDGSLSDRIFYEYSELSLSWAPRITHAANITRAVELMAKRRFDLVITVVRVGRFNAETVSRQIKRKQPNLPVVLLIFDEADLRAFPTGQAPATIDHVFQWTGHSGALIAMIKSIEDQRNAEHDTAHAGVQVILVVEDQIRAYSSFLSLLYSELLTQSGSLIAEGLNDFHRLMRMRARPKILLTQDYESAARVYDRFRDNICALISDVRIPQAGAMAPEGGLALARSIRQRHPDMPFLLHSAESHEAAAQRIGATFVNKNARNFRGEVRLFLTESLGFGDFVFRLPNRKEVARARDVYEMEATLPHVPAESIRYHATRNHFSVWLRARSLFGIAARIQPHSIGDFDHIEHLRTDLIDVLQQARVQEQEGVITDLYARHTGPENRFVRIGRGSIGGKGRSLAFVSTQIVRHSLLHRFEGLQIRIPKTLVLGTDAFDRFMDRIDLDQLLTLDDDQQVTEVMQSGRFPDLLLQDLSQAMGNLKGPLAVRSSSLLEDSRFRPFAGVYATYMLPNNHADPEFRFRELLQAIKAVYASAFWHDARTYLASTPHDAHDQKMAVVVQQVVGQSFDNRFYPMLSGVAQSYNYYPIGGQTPDEGVAHIALGLGHTVVAGGVALRFSPGTPTVLPQFPTATSFLEGSQHQFWAVDIGRSSFDWSQGPEASLVRCDLSQAESDGTLAIAGSVYDAQDDVIRENLALRGPRLVTFNNILKWHSVPLAEALGELLSLLRGGIGEEIEVEFALDVRNPADRGVAPDSGGATVRLYILQVRPMSSPVQPRLHRDIEEFDRESLACRTEIARGHGSYERIRDIVQVRSESLDASSNRSFIDEIGKLNAELQAAGRPYLLIGPGRWGSSDTSLGIGVGWTDIAGACVIMETPIGSRRIEPSQGTHFFQNITAARIGYLTITATSESWLDEAWLDGLWGGSDDVRVRHLRLAEPLAVHIDGRRGHAVVLKHAGDCS